MKPSVVSAPEEPTLVFQWERRSRARRRLAALVALSLAAHALTFYVFQVAYEPTASQPPPPAQALLIPPERPDTPPEEREEIRSLVRWLDLADPALAARPAPPPAAEEIAALGFRYAPSYEGAAPHFKPLEPPAGEDAAPAPPRPRPLGPVPASALGPASPAPPATPRTGGPARVILSDEIAPLAPAPLPPVHLAARIDKALEPTVFLVGARAEGGEPFLFRQSESGDPTADEAARDYLARLPFRPAPEGAGVVWGWAEVDWGVEAYR